MKADAGIGETSGGPKRDASTFGPQRAKRTKKKRAEEKDQAHSSVINNVNQDEIGTLRCWHSRHGERKGRRPALLHSGSGFKGNYLSESAKKEGHISVKSRTTQVAETETIQCRKESQ